MKAPVKQRVRGIDVGGVKFANKGRLLDHVRCILYRHEIGADIVGEDAAFVFALLGRHPQVRHKVGCGVEAFFVGWNDSYQGNREFWLRRTDGTTTEFSFRECVSPSSKKSNFDAALRKAIVPQIREFKAKAVAALGPTATCPVTGMIFNTADGDVDHKAPMTFAAIEKAFVEEHNIDIESVELTGWQDGEVSNQLADPDLAEKWTTFHRQRAVFRLVSTEGNIAAKKLAHQPFISA